MSLMEPITCPYCGTTGFNFYIYHNGVTIYPELGKEVRGCYACRGLFGVGDVAANGSTREEE